MTDWYFLGTIYTVSNNVAKNGLLDWGWLSIYLCAVSFSHSSSSVGAILCPPPPSPPSLHHHRHDNNSEAPGSRQKPAGELSACYWLLFLWGFSVPVSCCQLLKEKKKLTAYYVELHKGHFSLASLEIWPVGWEWTVTQLHSLVFGGAS